MSISVCIPARDAEKCLPDCFRTLKSQTIQPLEYIFCIGPSNDKTEELIKNFQKQNLIPIHIIYDKDGKGTTYASQLMFEKAKGEFILWLSTDAIFPVNWIEVYHQIIKKYNSNIDMVSTISEEIGEEQALEMRKENKFPPKINMSTLKLKSGIHHACSMIKKDTLLKSGGFDMFFVRGQDRDLVSRFRIMGYKGLWSEQLKYLHTGLIGKYSKALDRATFSRFVYKYGMKYIFLEKEHTLGFMLRISFLASLTLLFPLHLLKFTTFGFCWFLISTISLLSGTIFKHRFINLDIYLIQIGKCFGEVLTIYKILMDKNKKEYGYGKKLFKRSGKK